MTDFRTFLASLAATTVATLHHVEKLLAETAKPDTGEQIRTTLATSQQLIDTLALLEQKTKGNLTADEGQFLQSALAELRISYVRVLDRSRSAATT
jgi:predicted aconitase